jgi:hypothetical protein
MRVCSKGECQTTAGCQCDTSLAQGTQWLSLEVARLNEEVVRLRNIIRRRLKCDGSHGRYHAGEHFELTQEMNAEAAKLES